MNAQSVGDSPKATGEPVTLRSFGDFPEPDPLFPHAFQWNLAAGRPYYSWLCGGHDAAERVIAMWMRQPSSEIFIERTQFVMYGSEIAGGYIPFRGAEVKKARNADMESLWAAADMPSRAALIDKISQGLKLFAPVEEDEYYGSKMGVTRSFRGKGLTQNMFDHFFNEGRSLGYSNFRLDVQAENKHALRWYFSNGFEIVYTGQTNDGKLTYHAMRCERKNK